MKVIHMHNIAFVATTLVNALNEIEGVEAIFFERESYRIGTWGNIKDMIRFRKLIKREKPDIVHIHYGLNSLYAIFANVNYILHVHGSDVRGMTDISKLKQFKLKLHGIVLKYLLNKANKVFYSTPDLKKDIEIIRKDTIFVPNPVKYCNIIKNDYKFLVEAINVLFFASLSDAKGADIALPALEELKKIYKERINIVCINFGYQKEKYNKSKYINYVDKIEHDKVNDFLEKFDIVVGQLEAGAIGVSELEVMGLGIPLISNFKYNDFYDEPCPLISCDSSEMVIREVQRLINDEDLRERTGKKQINWVKKYHEDKNVSSYLLELYNNIIYEVKL